MVDVGSQHLLGVRPNNLKLFVLIGIDVQLIFFIWTDQLFAKRYSITSICILVFRHPRTDWA